MGIFDDEITLPGVFTQVEADYSYGYDPTLFGTTDSMLVIGTAFNGPVGTPTPVYSVEHAVYIFGSAYDSATRREASLVPGIQDAWDRGCRTIYAVRIGGTEMYKDFNLRVDSPYKLRVSSLFPANIGKDCYFTYDNSVGAEQLVVYKPAERATISEKKSGAVTSDTSVLKNVFKLASDYGYTKNTRLVDLVNTFNNNVNNNVLKMAIVDANGVDVTNSNEAYSLSIGALHPGVYFIGRSESKMEEHTEVRFFVKKGDDTDPYDNMTESYYRTLALNTDVSQPLPIYANGSNLSRFRELLEDVSISTSAKTTWKFLETLGLSDRAFAKDDKDYEETDLSVFEIYKRLGSGYAVNAKAIKRVKTDSKGNQVEITPRVIEVPISDKNHVAPIVDGIYNVLEDANIKYRALVCAHADEKIDGKLPRANDFKKAFADSFLIADNKIMLTPKVAEDDFTNPKKYKVELKSVDAISRWDERETVYTGEVFRVTCIADKTFDELVADYKSNGKKPTVPVGEQFFVKTADPTRLELVRSTINGPVRKNDPIIYAGENFIADGKLFTGLVPDGMDTIVFVESTIDVDTAPSIIDDLNQPLQDAAGNDPFLADGVTPNPAWTPTYAKITVPGIDNSKFTIDGQDFEYILGTMNDTVYAFKVENGELVPVGTYDSVFGTDEDVTISSYVENFPFGINDVVISSSIFDGITLEELATNINEDNALGVVFEAEVESEATTMNDDIISEIIDFTKPVVSTVVTDRHIGYDYSMYIPYRSDDNFARQLAQHCTYTELKTAPAFGFIGCSKMNNTSLSNIAAKVKELLETDFDLVAKNNYGISILDRNSQRYPIGKNLNLVFTQYSSVMSNDGYGYLCNGAAGYAGMVSTLPLDQSSTMQPIDINDINFYLSQNQLNQLTKAGIVTLRKSFTKGITVTDGTTMAPAESVFRRLASSRIVGACEDLIRAASEPFIGKQNHAANRNALNTAIKSNLNKIVGTLIETFEFKMVDTSTTAKLSYISIDYTIVPIYEIREIRNNIRISDSLTTVSANVG